MADLLERIIENKHYEDYGGRVEFENINDNKGEDNEFNIIPFKKKSKPLFAIKFPVPQEWKELAAKAIPGSRAYFIALGHYYDSLGLDHEGNRDAKTENFYEAYKIFKQAIEKFEPDRVLLNSITYCMHFLYDKHYKDAEFLYDILHYNKQFFELRNDDWGDLSSISDVMDDFQIYLEEAGLDKERKESLELSIAARKKMFEINPHDNDNLHFLINNYLYLGDLINAERYYHKFEEFARKNQLMDNMLGRITFCTFDEVKEELETIRKKIDKQKVI